jgi:CHAD domain-containing protein
MSYELRPDESIADGARRILRKQAENTLPALTGQNSGDRDESVHDARKRFKKIRAALRLWRDVLRPKDYQRENLGFRDAARPLTEVRDAAVLIEALDGLAKTYPGEAPDGEVELARNVLTERRNATRKRVLEDEQALAHVAQVVGEAIPRLEALKVRGKGWSALEGGLRRVYRAGRKSFAVAREEPTVENLHEWRKQAKYLWHELEVLHGCDPVIMDGLAEHAHQLGDLLGDDHDLAVLHDTLAGAVDAGTLLNLIQRRRGELQRAAYEMGHRVYADRSADFLASIGRPFRRWRKRAAATM